MDGLMMLGGALSGGAKAADELATGQINDTREAGRARILADIQLERQKAMDDYKAAKEDDRRVKRTTEIESEAGLIASKRVTAPADVDRQADAAAKAYGDSSLSDEDKAKGLNAVAAYRRENEQPNKEVTSEDRYKAAVKLGHIKPEDAVKMERDDKKTNLAERAQTWKEENAEANRISQEMIADKRFAAMLQAAVARGGKDGKDPAEVATANWLLEKGIAKTADDAWKMAHSYKDKVGEDVKSDGDGGVTIVNRDSGEIKSIDRNGKVRILRGDAGQKSDDPLGLRKK